MNEVKLYCCHFLFKGPGIPFYSLIDNQVDEGNLFHKIWNDVKQDKSVFLMSCLCFYILEHKVLEDNTEFSKLISDIQMPTMRRDTIRLAGYGEFTQRWPITGTFPAG